MRLMEIDLQQLPIPDWGLSCPNCQYLLRGLPTHRCPECGLELEMEEIVKSWTRLRDPRFTGLEEPFPDFGLECANCGHPLAGATGRTCPQCGERFYPESLRPKGPWFRIDQWVVDYLPTAILEHALAQDAVPFVRREDQSFRSIYGMSSEVTGRMLVSNEFFFDFLWVLRQQVEQYDQDKTAARGKWACSQCGESNPGNFQLCWKCGREYDNQAG
jgi:rubrerythrin